MNYFEQNLDISNTKVGRGYTLQIPTYIHRYLCTNVESEGKELFQEEILKERFLKNLGKNTLKKVNTKYSNKVFVLGYFLLLVGAHTHLVHAVVLNTKLPSKSFRVI